MPQQQDLFAAPLSPVAATPGRPHLLTAVSAFACDQQWYGTYSAYYTSMAQLSCAGVVCLTPYVDPLDSRLYVWQLCAAHYLRLTTCHGCDVVGLITPFTILHRCATCMGSEH